ncbi:MAG: PdxA family dehydrogenase [Burkholderiales bacterium]
MRNTEKQSTTTSAVLPRVAITLGDPAGIGPEIALKAALDPAVRAMCRPILFGDRRALEAHARCCRMSVRIDSVTNARDAEIKSDAVALVNRDQFTRSPLRIGQLAAAHGESALDSARAAISAAMTGEVEAVVAAPQTESAIKLTGIEFDGYPTFVARCTGTPAEHAFLMLCFDRDRRETRIVHTTLHVSLRRALDLVTQPRVEHVIRATDTALRRIGIASPRIAVAGLNPHASESGLFGDEEEHIIGPAIAAAKASGIDAAGPFGADTMLHLPGYDAYIVMYHDQGHIAAKAMARNRTAGLTIGTPVLFSSVAHGSALDIAGKNQADSSAMVEAIRRLVGGATSK